MWSITPGEFYGILFGRFEADRNRRYWSAVIACSMGGGEPFKMIGESAPVNEDDGDPDGMAGWGGGDDKLRRQRLRAERDYERTRLRQRQHRRYAPDGLSSAFESVDEQEEVDSER
jgi:hypothetical protein